MIGLHGFAHELREAGVTIEPGAEWAAIRPQMVDLKKAFDHGDRASIARELADVCLEAYKIAAAHGIYLDDAIKEVHASQVRIANGEPFRTPVMAKAINKRAFVSIS